MLNKYDSWIRDYIVVNRGDIYRKCVEVTIKMKQVFPELQIVKGLVQIFEDEKWYQHQWLVDQDGNIIDPTAEQWLGILQYREIKEDDPKPVGKCINCGEWIFEDSLYSVFCSEICCNNYQTGLI